MRAWWRDFQDSRRASSQDDDTLIGRALRQHKLHFSEVYGLRRDQSDRIFLKNDVGWGGALVSCQSCAVQDR